MDNQERTEASEIILQVIRSLQQDPADWVDFARIGAPLSNAGIQYKQFGFPKLRPFLNSFQDILMFKDEVPEGKPPICYVRPKNGLTDKDSAPIDPSPICPEAANLSGQNHIQPVRTSAQQCGAAQISRTAEPYTGSDIPTEKASAEMAKNVLQVVRSLQTAPDAWVDFARMGAPLNSAGIQYKQFGFLKLRTFLNSFQNILDFRDEQPEGKTPICYVRPKSILTAEDIDAANTCFVSQSAMLLQSGEQGNYGSAPPSDQCDTSRYAANRAGQYPYPRTNQHGIRRGAAPQAEQNAASRREKKPTKDTWLFNWAFIHDEKIKALSELALPEKWYYGSQPAPSKEQFPILKNYLAYTFRRLVLEEKVPFATDTEHMSQGEYAAFNTGLVDKKYEYIYALFKQNPRPNAHQFWYLLAFAVAGEDIGKNLVRLFNPLPERANYFENKIENMLYDSSTGDLSCDYTHILTERTNRLPLDFLLENCPADFLDINGIKIEDVYHKSMDNLKKAYFTELGNKIQNNSRILNRLKNRIQDAVNLAQKRVEWNYKTAIPMYYPTKNRGSLLLPLALMDEDRVDLALVVERQVSGSYQGQTILPLNLAYTNSRLVARPDSDWLRTDLLATSDDEDLDDED